MSIDNLNRFRGEGGASRAGEGGLSTCQEGREWEEVACGWGPSRNQGEDFGEKTLLKGDILLWGGLGMGWHCNIPRWGSRTYNVRVEFSQAGLTGVVEY